MKQLPSQETLRGLFSYDPETGVLAHISRRSGVRSGARAGSLHLATGYRHVGVNGKVYQEHRLIWKMVHGQDPEIIDHINADRSDNRLCNLRSCTTAANNRFSAEKRGRLPLGVRQARSRGKDYSRYQARAKIDGKLRHLGYFDTPEQAHQAYLEATCRLS